MNWVQRFLASIQTHKGDVNAHHTPPGDGDLAPKAHKDEHDPIDGGDKLDTAVPVKVGAANAIGSSHSLARADHVHEREHAKTTAIWTLAETLSPSGVTNINSSVLAAHDLWMVIIDLWAYDEGAGKEAYIRLNFNDDTSALYGYRVVDNTSIVIVTSTNYIKIGSLETHSAYLQRSIGQLLINGKGGGNPFDMLAVTGMFAAARIESVAYDRLLNGFWQCGASNITKFNFTFGYAMTGKILLYYKDY